MITIIPRPRDIWKEGKKGGRKERRKEGRKEGRKEVRTGGRKRKCLGGLHIHSLRIRDRVKAGFLCRRNGGAMDWDTRFSDGSRFRL